MASSYERTQRSDTQGPILDNRGAEAVEQPQHFKRSWHVRLEKMVHSMMSGDQDAVNRWMSTPQSLLGGKTPSEYASTEDGARDVETLVGRLEHGVFS